MAAVHGSSPTGVVSDAGLLADGDLPAKNPAFSPRRLKVSAPVDADELWSRMWEVDEPTAIELLISLEVSV